MKVLHVAFTYLPDPPGGTEVYVGRLCGHLDRAGVECVIAAPGPFDRIDLIDGIKVRRFACEPDRQTLETLYGAGDPIATASFERVLIDERPDVVHQHALSPACSIELVRCATRHGVPVVFTVHTPSVFCQRGTLLRWGKAVCDAAWSPEACTPCVLDGSGAGGAVGRIVSVVPDSVGRAVGRHGLSGGAWTALQMPALMRQRLAAVDELFATAARVVSLCHWTTRLLTANGVASDRIVHSPHGVDAQPTRHGRARSASAALRLVHLGRLDPAKGTAVIVQAMALDPSLQVTLDIYGSRQTGSSGAIVGQIRTILENDARITLHPAIPQGDVGRCLQDHDVVLVPSQTAETGPLVVLEAFAAGVPVVGSALPGITEKVRHDVDGLLVEPFNDAEAWHRAIRRCVDEPELLPRLRNGIVPPRTVAEVAHEMDALYREIVATTVMR